MRGEGGSVAEWWGEGSYEGSGEGGVRSSVRRRAGEFAV